MWQIEIYSKETKLWTAYGKPSTNYPETYKGCVRLCEAGYKARIRKVG